MTTPQLRWRELQESKRHNAVTEEVSQQANREQARTNRASEAIRAYANELQKYGIETTAATARETAKLNAATSKYATDTNAATSRYATNTNSTTSRYATDARLKTDLLNANASILRAKTDALNGVVNRAKSQADIVATQARVQQILAEITNLTKQYSLNAREQDNRDALRKANIAQGWVNTATNGLEKITRSFKDVTSGFRDNIESVRSLTTGVLDDVLKALDSLV